MSLEIIFIILLLASLSGIGFILFRKVPILLELPQSSFQKEQIISNIKKEIQRGLKIIPGSKKFDYELYLQKILSKEADVRGYIFYFPSLAFFNSSQ